MRGDEAIAVEVVVAEREGKDREESGNTGAETRSPITLSYPRVAMRVNLHLEARILICTRVHSNL